MMKCPKCGYERQPRDKQFVPATECPACGIVYAKSGPLSDFGVQQPSSSLPKKSSPVDEQSLKKARERVEKRLRKQLESRVRDEKHARTLERARHLTALALEKRRAEHNSEAKAAATKAEQAETGPDTDSEPILDLVDVAVENRSGEPVTDPQTNPAPAAETPRPADEMTVAPPEPLGEQLEAQQMQPGEADIPPPLPHNQEVDEQPEQPAAPTFQADEAEHEQDVALHSVRQRDTNPQEDSPAPQAPSHGNDTGPRGTRGGLTRLLPMVAWMILVAGVIGAILSWTTLKDVQAADLRTAQVTDFKATSIGLLLGFAYLATGVLGFAFFWVSSLINRQLSDIRHLLLNLPLAGPASHEEPRGDTDDASDGKG